MNIGLIKIEENDSTVLYKAYQNVPTSSYTNKSGSIRYNCENKYATVKYYKKIPDLEYVWNETDAYFHEKKNVAEYMLALIFGKMNRCNREGHFPEKMGIATG